MFLYRHGRVSFCWRLMSGVILLSFMAATVQPALAQSNRESDLIAELDSDEATPASTGTFDPSKLLKQEKGTIDGTVEAEILAEGIKTGSKVGLGIGIGLLTGLIGTGIGYFVVGPAPMTPEALKKYTSGNNDYKIGFKAGWDNKTRSKKRGAFLGGGLIGSAIVLGIYLGTQN